MLKSTVRSLNRSAFIIQFNSLATYIESSARTMKNTADNYNAESMARLEASYNASVQRFNNVLVDLKDDMLDSRKMKSLSTNPNQYAEQYKRRLEEARVGYMNSYARTKAEVQGDESADGILPFAALVSHSRRHF